jgi:hypothetical protein
MRERHGGSPSSTVGHGIAGSSGNQRRHLLYGGVEWNTRHPSHSKPVTTLGGIELRKRVS